MNLRGGGGLYTRLQGLINLLERVLAPPIHSLLFNKGSALPLQTLRQLCIPNTLQGTALLFAPALQATTGSYRAEAKPIDARLERFPFVCPLSAPYL